MPIQLGAPPQHGFDEPLGLMSDCHRRIEHFLEVLRKIATCAGGRLTEPEQKAVEAALKYFQISGPRHNEDEERSLFPLLRNSENPDARAAFESIDSLEHEHAAAAPAHQEIDRLYRQWIDRGMLPDDRRQTLIGLLESLKAMYQKHIEAEEKAIFPLAARVLNQQQLQQVGGEMARRRGLVPTSSCGQGKASCIIDVRTIPGPQRHPLIFHTFDRLEACESIEIVNDHNPVPLRNQFSSMRVGQFSWDYLQDGPDLWRVRISKIAVAAGDSALV